MSAPDDDTQGYVKNVLLCAFLTAITVSITLRIFRIELRLSRSWRCQWFRRRAGYEYSIRGLREHSQQNIGKEHLTAQNMSFLCFAVKKSNSAVQRLAPSQCHLSRKRRFARSDTNA
jgi:hypothetical protein